MKMDRTTKIILLFIALGLWGNILLPLVRPAAVRADEDSIESTLDSMQTELAKIANGTCLGAVCQDHD